MNVSEPSFLSTILSFLFNLLMYLIVTILGFFGLATSTFDSDTGMSSSSPTPAAISSTPAAVGEIAQSSENLVNAAWLSAQLGDPNLRVIALAEEFDFEFGHIPGAVQVDWGAFSITDTSDASIATWQSDVESTLTSLGITRDDTVVVYDYGTHYSPRLWWILKQMGQEHVYLLDGGFDAWMAQSQPFDMGSVWGITSSESYVGIPGSMPIATKTDVEDALDDSAVTLVDARSPEEFAAGHIPGAVNIPFESNYGIDGTLLDLDALTDLYTSAGVTPDSTVIVYCSTGVRAASDVFALTELAYPDVSLYLGSFNEWSADPSLPVEKS